MKPCDNCKRKPCPAACYPLKDWERGQKKRGKKWAVITKVKKKWLNG